MLPVIKEVINILVATDGINESFLNLWLSPHQAAANFSAEFKKKRTQINPYSVSINSPEFYYLRHGENSIYLQ